MSALREAWRCFRVLMSFSFTAAPRQAALFLLCGAYMALGGPINAVGAKYLVDALFARDVTGALVAGGCLALAAALSLLNTLYYLAHLFVVAEKAGFEANRRLMRLIGGVPGLAHHELPEYLKELDTLREQRYGLAWMTNSTAGMVRVVVQLVATVALFSQLHWALLLLPLFGFGSFWAGRKAQAIHHATAEALAEDERRRRHLFETCTSAAAGKEIRVFALQRELLERHHQAAMAVLRRRDAAAWQAAALNGLGSLLFAVGYLGAIALVVWQAVNGQASPGDVVLTVGLAGGMNAIISTAVGYGTGFLSNLRVAKRYLWLLDYAERAHPDVSESAPAPDRLAQGIELRDVTFRYPGTGALVLDRVSLTLPAGRVVALVGENGAGKTTLVKLLSRFYEPDEGQILVDGVPLQRISVDEWRARCSAAFQDFARFEFLARETVGVGHLAYVNDGAAVQDALVRAAAEDVPPVLARGLEPQLGKAWPEGAELSGGQWQKLALARALMRPQPLLLVFDEPTSALDPQTEHALFERLAATARLGASGVGTITLLVSHRFSTVRMADQIVVLEGGRIKEQGSHEQLMRLGGSYAELYTLQARAYR